MWGIQNFIIMGVFTLVQNHETHECDNEEFARHVEFTVFS